MIELYHIELCFASGYSGVAGTDFALICNRKGWNKSNQHIIVNIKSKRFTFFLFVL